jgi:transcription-repair coupling factor (superfamily II helicase)
LRIVVAPIQAIIQPLPTPAALDANSLSLAVGQSYEPEKIASWLTDRGFERLDQVEQPGDFALRGGILDIFATADVDPVRLEFLGDEIESIRQFETGTQRSARELTSTRVTLPPDPAKALPIDTTMFMSYLPANTLMVLHEPVEIAEVARTVLDRLGNPVGHFSFEAIHKRLAHHGAGQEHHRPVLRRAVVLRREGLRCRATTVAARGHEPGDCLLRQSGRG